MFKVHLPHVSNAHIIFVHTFCQPLFVFQLINGECRIYYSWPSDEMKTIFGIIIIFVQFIIPFIILICCYGKIVWMLSQRINTDITDAKNQTKNNEDVNVTDQAASADTKKHLADLQKDKFQLARRNTIKTLLTVGLCFIICWSQNQVYYLMYNLGYDADWNSIYFQFTVLMVFLNSTVNPFIYLIKYQDYQVALRQFLRCKTKEKDENSISTTSNQTNFSNI